MLDMIAGIGGTIVLRDREGKEVIYDCVGGESTPQRIHQVLPQSSCRGRWTKVDLTPATWLSEPLTAFDLRGEVTFSALSLNPQGVNP